MELLDEEQSKLTDGEELPDLNDVALADLLTLDSPNMLAAGRRIAAQDDESNGIVAGFQSAI